MAEKGEMKSWEFLLQKEGDRTWLPLENPTVEILEGRYRVVARTPCAKEEVDIYVSFVSSEDDPPKRRIQQRSHGANDDGLLAILPFTPFRPGLWELRCRPHVEAGDVAQQWQSQIQLQVLPQEEQGGGDDLFGWDRPQDDALDSQVTTSDAPAVMVGADTASAIPNSDSPIVDSGVSEEALSAAELDPATASEADIQRLAEEMSQMVAESASDASPTETGAHEGAAEAPLVPDAAIPNLPSPGFTSQASAVGESSAAVAVEGPGIAIALEEAVVVMNSDRRVTVRGQIVGPNRSSANPADSLLPAELLLTLELRDPSTTEIWASYRESFSQAIAPISFSSDLQLPTACRTQLCLGNVTLWQVEEGGNLDRLVSQDFNAMVAMDALLDHARQSESVTSSSLDGGAVSNLQQQAASNFLGTKFGAQPKASKGNLQINTELLNLLKPTSRSATGQGAERSSPTVARSEARPAGAPRIELPSFGNARPVAIPLADSLADDLAQDSSINSGGELSFEPDAFSGDTIEAQVVMPEGEVVTPEGEVASSPTADLSSDMEGENPFALPLDGSPGGIESLLADGSAPVDSSIDATAGAIPLADELGQASALEPELPMGTELAQDDLREPSSLLLGEVTAAGGLSLADAQAIAPADGESTLVSNAGLDHEVVVDDEEMIPPAKLAWMQPSPSEALIDEDISVPVPELTVPEVELVKGDVVRIQVRVAQEPARLCARVWLLDCQSRTLLGEPQWITAFLPLGDDLMEANVDLVIPEGSIELQIEAIAVEPMTQRESLKVSTRRKVSLGDDGKDLEDW